MLNWSDLEVARLHREELLREAARERLARDARCGRRRPARFLAALAVLHRRLHELDTAVARAEVRA